MSLFSPRLPWGNIEVEGNKFPCFPRDLSLSVLFYLPTQTKKKLQRNRLIYAGWLTNLPRFQGARADHVQVEGSCCCFPRELVSFHPKHVMRSPQIGKRI